MRRVLIAGNWKMNKMPDEAAAFVSALKEKMTQEKAAEVLVCPPAIYLQKMIEEVKGTDIEVGAQNAFYEESGAFTGELSPVALAQLGTDYIIIGHSERRQGFGETDEDIAKKAKAIFDAGVTPIICCGETLEQREEGIAKDWIAGQIRAALKELSNEQIAKAVIAYEPIWAIGTGKTASPQDAEEICAAIRDVVFEVAGKEASEATRVLYGGSVKPANVDDILAQENIDGALVGGASLEVDSFMALVDAAE
ncbi:MAG: triose-phosphate isomerase [Aerococcus sp.]|nr:triose-phosphate isomerase [Aerococcus sp.]